MDNRNQTISQPSNNPDTLAQRGETNRLMGRYEAALGDFDRAIALKPDYAWAYARRGETHRLMNRYEAALADFNRAVTLKPDYAWALAHRGVIYRLMGHYEAALADFDRAIALKPDYIWAYIHQGNSFIGLGRYEEGLINMDRAFALDKTLCHHWHGGRGLVLNYLGRYAEAIACCKQGLKANSNDHIALYSLIIAKARWQGLDKAQAEITKTQALLQTVLQGAMSGAARAEALYRLGGLAALQGRTDQGLNYLQEAIHFDLESRELARHDPAWVELRIDPRFQALIAETIAV